MTNRNSFERLANWVADIRDNAPLDINIILIGNKSDLTEKRTTTYSEIIDFANSFNLPYIEVSAKTGNNIFQLFESLTKMLIKTEENKCRKKEKRNYDKSNNTNGSVKLNKDSLIGNTKIKENKCC